MELASRLPVCLLATPLPFVVAQESGRSVSGLIVAERMYDRLCGYSIT